MTSIIESECIPAAIYSLRDTKATGVLAEPPDLVRTKADGRAGSDLVHYLMTDKGNCLERV